MQPFSRRTFVNGAVAAGATLLLPRQTFAATGTVPAANFYNSVGINIHPDWLNTNWGTINWQGPLINLGVPNTRGMVGRIPTVLQRMQPLFNAGIKHCATFVSSNSGTLDKEQAALNLAFLKNSIGVQNLCGIEGPNEFNQNHPTNWAAIERDFVKWTFETVRPDPAFRSVPLVAPSIFRRIVADYRALGDLSPWVDKGCIHFYSGNKRPTLTGDNTMERALRDASGLAPAKPIFMTETGWMTGGNQPVSQRCQAKYILRNYCDTFGFGVEKTFVYQLMDDNSNLFGLCDARCAPKPAYSALKNFLSLVKDRTPRYASLGYTVGGAPSSLKALSLSKSDGTFILILWLDVDSWVKGRDVNTSMPISVNLSSSRNYQIFRPTFSDSTFKAGTGSKIDVTALDEVTVIRIA